MAHRTLLNVLWQPGWEGGLGGTDTCACMTQSLYCSSETIKTLFILCVCVCVCSVAQLCPILCDSMDCSLPGSYVHGNS